MTTLMKMNSTMIRDLMPEDFHVTPESKLQLRCTSAMDYLGRVTRCYMPRETAK